jgi:hypothetical protein
MILVLGRSSVGRGLPSRHHLRRLRLAPCPTPAPVSSARLSASRSCRRLSRSYGCFTAGSTPGPGSGMSSPGWRGRSTTLSGAGITGAGGGRCSFPAASSTRSRRTPEADGHRVHGKPSSTRLGMRSTSSTARSPQCRIGLRRTNYPADHLWYTPRPSMGGRKNSNDVDRCISGQCVGRNCPCLCHVESLRLAHYNGHLVRRRGRIPGVSPRKKARAKQRG